MANDDIITEITKILENGLIRESCNCIYNRKAVTFVYEHDKEIDKKMAVDIIQKTLKIEGKIEKLGLTKNFTDRKYSILAEPYESEDSNQLRVHRLIYQGLTSLKMSIFFLDRFLGNPKFVKTVLNKVHELLYELEEMQIKYHKTKGYYELHKLIINAEKVVLGSSQDCKTCIQKHFTDREVLDLANTLPSDNQ